MILGNLPKEASKAVPGKVYWRLSIGPRVLQERFFDHGWRAFELMVLKPFPETRDPYVQLPRAFRFAFAYWLPFYPL